MNAQLTKIVSMAQEESKKPSPESQFFNELKQVERDLFDESSNDLAGDNELMDLNVPDNGDFGLDKDSQVVADNKETVPE